MTPFTYHRATSADEALRQAGGGVASNVGIANVRTADFGSSPRMFSVFPA